MKEFGSFPYLPDIENNDLLTDVTQWLSQFVGNDH